MCKRNAGKVLKTYEIAEVGSTGSLSAQQFFQGSFPLHSLRCREEESEAPKAVSANTDESYTVMGPTRELSHEKHIQSQLGDTAVTWCAVRMRSFSLGHGNFPSP